MQFFEKHETADIKLINQLWQAAFLDSDARNEAIAIILNPLDFKNWLQQIFLVLGIVFFSASILLFFAYNWVSIPPYVKLTSILVLIGTLGIANFITQRIGKHPLANLILTASAFLIGVFMAVFGQIYQTGADAYTLFLTWAIMILPFSINAKFLPLWTMWLIVANIALATWVKLGFVPHIAGIKINYEAIMALFNIIVYFGYEALLLNESSKKLDRAWFRTLLAVLIFAPLGIYLFEKIFGFWGTFYNHTLSLNIVILLGFYLFIKLVKKSIYEYNVGYLVVVCILIFAIIRFSFEFDNYANSVSAILFIDIIAIGFTLSYAYKYYNFATKHMKAE